MYYCTCYAKGYMKSEMFQTPLTFMPSNYSTENIFDIFQII